MNVVILQHEFHDVCEDVSLKRQQQEAASSGSCNNPFLKVSLDEDQG